ncbi:MAG: AAA domain-containing protein [Flavobacteriales bacterium]
MFQEAKNLNKEARELEKYIVDSTIQSADVITSTLIGSTHEFLRERKFDVVIIDEAGQALEPGCWVPILKADKVVLAGDPYQLPPTVKSREAEKKGLTTTLLEKAINRLSRISLLEVQYRMNESIAAYSNQYFYAGKLSAHESVAERRYQDSFLPVEFIDTAGCGYEESGDDDGSSKSNAEEARIVEAHLEQLKFSMDNADSIAVISPYRGQVLLLQERFGEEENVVVNTIDSFQGQERDVVYISLVRSNDRGEIGFLRDYRRMNVAMTRAKKKLVVVGDSATLGEDKFFAGFLDYVEKSGSYRTAWEFM